MNDTTTQAEQPERICDLAEQFSKAYDHVSMLHILMWNLGSDDLSSDDARKIGRRGWESTEKMNEMFEQLLKLKGNSVGVQS